MLNLLGCTSAAAMLLMLSSTATAQDGSDEAFVNDEVVATGIRQSLKDAAAIRRGEAGVVDAITAEDIGKFPDANLAESLQRITGVSIDRQDNEGNQISVRGLGPSFNLVTLNGRQLPVASSPDVETLNSATQSRAFNFAEIASDSVSAVNVFKTSRAYHASGGIGATVDIQTTRPFDNDGTKFNFSAAGVFDSSTEQGDDVTPEIGGLFSHQFNDKFAILATGSYSRRNFRNESNTTESFDVNTPTEFLATDGPGDFENLLAAFPQLAGNDVIFTPRTFISEISDNQRERTNFQVVGQYRPVENLTLTADYTGSIFELEEQRQQTALFNLLGGTIGSITDIAVTENGTVSSLSRTGVAFDAIATDNTLRVENDSFGLNAKWESDNLTLELDGHLSESLSQPDGQSNDLVAIFQGALGVDVDITLDPDGGAPTIAIDGSNAFRGEDQFGGGAPLANITGAQDADAFSPLGSIGRVLQIENDVSQIQFKGTWSGDNDGAGLQSIDFGAGYIEYDVATRFTDFPFTFQGLVPCENICDASFFEEISTESFDGFFPSIFAFDAADAIDNVFTAPSVFPELGDISTVEETFSVYFNTNWEGDFNDWETKLSAGLRFETTDVTSSSDISFPTQIIVSSDSEATVDSDPNNTQFIEEEGSYTNFLPSVDFQISPREDVVLRASYGRTLARPDLNALRPGTQIADVRPGGPFNATLGNTDLQPFESDNIDLAAEYYYDEGSFFAVTYFHKSISNFIGTQIVQQPVLDFNGDALTDPTDRLVVDPVTNASVPVSGLPTDPVAVFDITQSVNSNDADVDGVEVALQHLFWDTGFGLQANYTYVTSDVEFDPLSLDQVDQSLIGLSDTANLVGFYENEKFQVRVAGNWRDDFLFATNQLRVAGEPVNVDSFIQVDASASYNVNQNFTVFVEALNITGEDQSQTGRFDDQFLFENDQTPRFTFGIRGSF
ncbi:MAG: TonB-dependent receptor [Maricaulaceae bacterium]